MTHKGFYGKIKRKEILIDNSVLKYSHEESILHSCHINI